jgi:hypothetical protein
VLTGTNYSTLLKTGEDASTDIKGRLDWSKLSWDINGDNATTADVSFTLADISSAKVTDGTRLSIVLTSAKGTALEATTGFGGTTADTIDVTAGFAREVSGKVATTDAVANAALSVAVPLTVTNTSGAYKAATDTLVFTGTNYATLLDNGEDASTDIKARLDWSKLVWDINGDNATTPNVSFTLTDISSAKVTDGTHLSIVLTSAKGTALEATTGYGGIPDTIDVTAGFARDVSGNVAITDAVANAPLSITLPPKAGDSVIDLGSYGFLIAPVQVDGGKWYYFWDRSGNVSSADTGSLNGSLNDGVDYTTHDVLDGIFNQDVNGVVGGGGNTSDIYRYATINGVKLALPTVGGVTSPPYGVGSYQPGTAVENATAAYGSNTVNATYNDLLAVWDAYNGPGTGVSRANGTPPGWLAGSYWSATSSASGDAYVHLNSGYVYATYAQTDSYVALQVL